MLSNNTLGLFDSCLDFRVYPKGHCRFYILVGQIGLIVVGLTVCILGLNLCIISTFNLQKIMWCHTFFTALNCYILYFNYFSLFFRSVSISIHFLYKKNLPIYLSSSSISLTMYNYIFYVSFISPK